MKKISVFTIVLLLAVVLVSCGQAAGGPQAWLDRPLDDSIIPLAPVIIQAHASDSDGVSQFQFEVDGSSIAEVGADGGRLSDASVEWTPPGPGTYLVSVRAVDSSGNLGSLATARVTVGGGPTPTPDALILDDSGTTDAEPVETTFARITNVTCGPDQTVFVDISIGNPQGVTSYAVFSTWHDRSAEEVFQDPLPQLVEKRFQLNEQIDTVDREHEFGLKVIYPGGAAPVFVYGTEPGGRCSGHYQEVVEMAPSDPIAPLANATKNGNCRRGPSLEYDIIAALLEGQTAEITGRSADGGWWQIDPGIGGKYCWIAGSVVQVSGDVSGVLVVVLPSLPVNTITPTPTIAPPVDNTPPGFYSADVAPDSILTDGTGCPGYDRTFIVAAAVADDGGLDSVYAAWSVGSETGIVFLSEGSLGYWAEIGPVNTPGTMTITIYAEDTSGNTSQYSPLYVTVQNCVG